VETVWRSADGRTLRAEIEVAAGGVGCPSDLAARLGLLPLVPELFEKLGRSLPAGCRVLTVEVPAGATVAGARFAAGSAAGEPRTCEPGSECAAGGCAFPVAPIVRRGPQGGRVLGIFQSTADSPRRAAMVVELQP
jgi:hypothetical protein